MAPKKEKKVEVLDENAWRKVIEETPLDDENWSVKVMLIEAAGSDQDRIYLNKFEVHSAEEKRFVIKNICKTETIFMINQLGGEKKIKDENLRVFEEAQSYLKDKKDIPPDVLALVIKHLIIKMKDEYLFIKRQRLEVKLGIQRESTTMIDKSEVRGTVSPKIPEPPEPSPPPKGKGKGDVESGLRSECTEGKKFNTMLRERGEEWRDKVYVDDYPTDGPNLYVAVTGFVEPYLPGCLVKVGIPLTAVVQVRIDPSSTSIPSGLLRATKRGQSFTELLVEKSIKFWDELQFLRIQRDSADGLKNTAFIVFSPPYWNSETLSGNPDKIYDELCFLMYDIQDLSRQHLHYKDNMSIMNIPEDIRSEHYMKRYQQQVDNLPLECVTVYSVLDFILQTACNNQDLDGETSRTSLSTAVTLNTPPPINEENKLEKTENLVKNIFNTLCNTEVNKKTYRLTYGQEYESHKDPIVLDYGDFAKYTTFQLGNINLDNIVFSSLLGMPINNLWRTQNRQTGELEAKVNFHVNVLLSCFDRDDVETAELNRLIHILASRKLYNNRSSLKKHHLPTTTISDFKKNYLKRSVLAEPLPTCPSLASSAHVSSPSFPSMTKSENEYEYACSKNDPEVQRLKVLFDCPDISELVTAAEIENGQPINHMIDEFDFFEDLSGISAFQIMREAFNKYNCVDYKYCEVTDCFILMFFNSHGKDGIAREEWRCHVTTPVCLQDFFDFILEEQYDWIQNEEKNYDENLISKTRSESKVIIDPQALKSCIETTDVETDLLMEGSLKYQAIIQVPDGVPEATDETEPLSKKSPSSLGFDSKSSKKTKSPSSPQTKTSFVGHVECQTSVEIPAKPFLGYDLGDRRVEVFGKDATFFSKDGTKVTSMYTLTIPMNLEYIVLNVLPGNSYNEFWVHKALGEYVNQEIIDTCESFRITSKDQVMMYIKKQTYQVPIKAVSVTDNFSVKKGTTKQSLTEKVSTTLDPAFETKFFHSLFVTWPNGMVTETIYENNSPAISHIKQYYTHSMPHLDEEMRCISLNGEVIIYKSSGDVEVLKPDGTYIIITKYTKRIIVPDTEPLPPPPPPDDVSDKNKKSKSKVSSKSSKMAGSDEDLLSEEKVPEYEVVVDEFEIIESNGCRQKWINNLSFDIEKLLIRTATDYCLGEVFSRRMDGTHFLINKDGLHVVTFPNQTRIITSYEVEDKEIYPEWTDVEIEYFEMFEPEPIEDHRSKDSVSQKSYTGSYTYSSATSISKKVEEDKEKERTDGYISVQILYTIEHPNFSTISINNVNGKVSVDSPNETTVIVDKSNFYDIKLDNVTSANFNGQYLNISYEACSECRSFTTCSIKIKTKDENSASEIKGEDNWLKMKDSFNKKVVVNEEGAINLSDEPSSAEVINTEEVANANEVVNQATDFAEEKAPDAKSETSVLFHGKCREMYLAKNIRFFILKRELTCAELLHRALLDQYERACLWKPWCSINQYDTFGDHRNLVSILTPIHLTESEKWLMDSKLSGKPKFLTYKDLKKDSGKGFYHWMRPYERFVSEPMKPGNVLPERLPRAFVLRTLEQEWDETQREELKGARELLKAVLRYRCVMEADSQTILNIPIIDVRPEDERRIDDIIQAIAHKIYEDLKIRLADDVQSRAKATITTKPPKEPEELSVEGEFEEDYDETKNLEEERESSLKETDAGEEMSPALRRYWRRRAEEDKEEQFYKYLLREGSVPPYFRNVLGGAIWWDMNYTASEAVTIAERRKMRCVCDEEGTSQADTSVLPLI